MTGLSAGATAGLWIMLAVTALLALRFYRRPLQTTLRGEGEVAAGHFRPLDFGVAAGMSAWLALLVAASASREAPPIQQGEVTQSALVFLAVVAVIGGRFWVRNMNPVEVFGFRRVAGRALGGRALLFFVAALPLFYVAAQLTVLWLGAPEQGQEIVEFFRESLAAGDRRAVWMTVFFAAIVAPICEETIFRGYLYGAFKRFAGPHFALLITAGLFAAVHMSATAFAPLFVLALCLSLAYEATGSLAVPMLMHAFFNAFNIAALFVVAQTAGG